MKIKLIAFLFLLLFIQQMESQQCPVLCDTCTTGSSTCSACYSGFQDTLYAQWIGSGSCPCPSGFFMNTTTQLCHFCPILCQTCSNLTTCLTCIPGYQLDNNKQCTKMYSNAGQWITMDVGNDLTQQKLQQSITTGFYLNNYIASMLLSNSIQTCAKLNSQLFFGMYSFDYNTEVLKSYFGLPHHDWIQIKFQFVAINNWTNTNMILEINDRESYSLNVIEGVLAVTQKEYSSNIRHRDFCLGGAPDNLGFFSIYLPHQASMLKIRIRTDLLNETSSDGSQYWDYVYFGLSNLFVRAGTCPTNCRKCQGPNYCLQCISPYQTTATGGCDCNTTIGQVTELGRCVPLCQVGYIFTKIGSMTQSQCVLCSIASDNLRNCFACTYIYNSFQCLICQQGFTLNSTTGLCSQNCPSNTFIKTTFDLTYHINRIDCTQCPANCLTCSFGVCSLCANGTVYQQGSCISTCSDGFYLDSTSSKCLKCLENCDFCTDINTCLKCSDFVNFMIISGSCIPKCTQYNNCSTTCDASCSQCYGTSSNQCISCINSTNFLQNSTCVTNCSANYFLLNGNKCAKCLSPCLTCSNYQSCQSCQTGYFLYSQSCVQLCPTNYYPDASMVCQSCSLNCKNCYNATSCTACANNYILFQGGCIVDTPCSQKSGFYYDEDTFQCLPCPDNCISCYKDLCYVCNSINVLDNGKCSDQCSTQKVKQQQIYFDPISQTNLTVTVCIWQDPLCNNYTMINGSSVCNQCIFMNPMLVLLTTNNQCSFTCPMEMTKVQVNNVVSCQACPINCLQCTSNLTCIKCSTNYVIYTSMVNSSIQCISSCPDGYTSDGYQCILCKVNCKTCDIMGTCYACLSGYTMTSSNTCLNDTSCASNQYMNSSMCLNCSTGCTTCQNSTVCASCGVSSLGIQYYLKQFTCVVDCSSGYFRYSMGNLCRKCPTQCLTCLSVTQCSICTDGYFLLLHPIQSIPGTQIGTCVKECPLGYFNYHPLNTDKEISTCVFCSSNCLSCYGSSEDQCLSCYGTFAMDNGRCVENCPAGKYEDQTGHCDWCDPSCLECTGPAQFQCITCNSGYYLYRSQCYLSSCPGSTYPVDYDSRICELCQWGCQVCSSPYNCSVCSGGFYLYEGWCYLQCPLNTQPYLDLINQGYRCGKCSAKWYNCVECVTSNCTRCAPSYFKLKNDCVASCPIGYYADLTPYPMCKNCPRNCISCASESKCFNCSSGYILDNDECSTSCPSMKYFNSLTSSCSNCSQYCQNCLSSYQCQNCVNGYYLYSGYVNGTLTSYCLVDCADYRYEDVETNRCQNCSSNCKTCTAMNNCTKCLSGYTLLYGYCYPTNNTNPTCNILHCLKCLNSQICETCDAPYFLLLTTTSLTQTSSCVSVCPNGTFSDGKNCKLCNSTCTLCTNGPNDCSLCASGFYLFEKRCWKQCPIGFYKNNTLNQCLSCSSDCFDCLSSIYCQTCQLHQKFYQGFCHDLCPDGTYEQDQVCVDCSSTCIKCDSLSSCSQCQSGYVLYENQCLLDCPSGTYLSLTELICKECRYPCDSCKSEDQCTTCVDSFVYDSQISKCVMDCGDGRYAKNASINGYECSSCPQNCNDCFNSTYCLNCINNKLLWRGKCVSACPIGTYIDLSSQKCKACSPYCLACVAYEACIQCHNQTVLYNGKCLTFCPSGTYQVSEYSYDTRTSTNLCKNCLAPCNQCNGSSVYNCKSCVSNFYLYESICVNSCPTGTYAAGIETFSTLSVQVNLIKNGDFSTNKCQNDSCIYNSSAYNGDVDGWVPDTILQIGYGRLYSVYLTTERVVQLAQRNSCAKQIIPLLTIGDYFLQFTYAARKNRQFSDCQFTVSFNGQTLSQILPADYLLHTQVVNLSLTANLTNVTLEFCSYSGSNSNYGSVIKGISLVKKTTQMTSFDTSIVNSLQAKCNKCPVGCATCANKTNCTSCITNWTLNSNNACKPNSQCSLQNCEICEFTTLSVCRKCVEPYNLISNILLPVGTITVINTTFSCVLTCPVNTFQSDNYTCLSCPANCSSCRYTECTSCQTGFYLYKTSCVNTCPAGYMINSAQLTCVMVTCLYNNSNGDCVQCLSPYLLQKGKCVTVCGNGTYQEDNVCINCDSVQSHCFNCASLTTCTSCIAGYFYLNGACIANCPSTQYLTINASTLTQTCTPCSDILQGCLYCTNSTNCTQCLYPYFLAQGVCVSTCPYNAYRSPYKQECIICSQMISNCLSCWDQITCISCVNGTYLVNGKCTSQCSNGYFLNSTTLSCQICYSKCFTCTSASNCSTCKQGYFLLQSTFNAIMTYTCTETCPIGFYPSINSTCIPCSSQCLTCTFEKCLSCPMGTYLLDGKCLTACPDHYFASNGQCIICNPTCKTCTNGESQCATCYDGFIYNSTTSNCFTNCTLPNQYYDSLTYSCSNCSASCQTCYGPRYDQCITCSNSYSLNNGLCISQCPVGFYRDSNSICRQCDLTQCLTCQGNATNCSSCEYPNVLIVSFSLNGRCGVNCGSGFYYDFINGICTQCSSGCTSCVNSISCSACESGKFLYQDICVSTCPAYFVQSLADNTCKMCPLNCNQCSIDSNTQQVQCTQCISPLYLVNGACYTSCPSITYLSGSQCVPCQNNCLTCKDQSRCISCNYPYVFYENNCLIYCPTGFVNLNQICVPSHYCAQVVYNGSCYSQCPVSTYLVPNTSQCVNCGVGCLSCISSNICESCSTGLYLYITSSLTDSCVQQCPLTTYANGKYCVNCPSPCNQCIIQNNKIECVSCLTGYFYNGNCITACPNGYFVNASSSQCQKCNSLCSTCDSSGCIICSNSMYSPPNCQSSSTITCLSNQYLQASNNSCVNCNAACASCYGPTAAQCITCANSSSVVYYLYISSCLSDCPVGYVKNNTINQCTLCSVSNCINCSQSSTNCNSCLSGYILVTNYPTTKCVLNCNELNLPSTNYIYSTASLTCISCSSKVSNCFDCYFSALTGIVMCKNCASSYYLYPNNTCLPTCSSGFYLDQNNNCMSCGANCNTCTNTTCSLCNLNYTLYQGQCISSCPQGYYSDFGTCTACETNCKVCNSSQCTQCTNPYALDTLSHCTSCISGYFMNSVTSTCQQCSTNCLQCSTSSTKCTKCPSSLFFFNDACSTICPSGYYGNTALSLQSCTTCQSLVTNCSICLISGCTKCKDTFYLYAGSNSTSFSCVSQCPSGYYPDNLNMICLKCMISNCSQCSSSSQCTLCTSPFILFAGSCLQSCPLGYASTSNTSNLYCIPCQSGCKDCSFGIDNCSVCNVNLQNNNNGSCSLIPNSCLAGEYLNSLGTCSSCYPSCLTCYGGSQVNCLTCSTPEYSLQMDGSCQAICVAGTYYDSISSQCQPCSNKYGVNCSLCDSTQCYNCLLGMLSNDGQSCVTSCSGSTYLYNGICTNCSQYCFTCASATNCTQCINSNYILYNNLCYSSCPLMTQSYNNSCRACDTKCLVCVGTTTNCTSCQSIYRLYENTCLEMCPSGTYESSIAGVSNIVCLNCTSPCLTCSVTATNCTLCPTTLYLWNYQCLSSCPVQTFLNSTTLTCVKCQYPCLNCQYSSTYCTSCQSGFIYSSVNHNCSSQCSDGMYLTIDSLTNATSCTACTLSNCKFCDSTQCYKCSANSYATLSATDTIINCTTTCPDYYFIQASTFTCQKCENLCITCTSSSDCQKCVTPYFLYSGQCLTSCPDQTYSVLNGEGYQCKDCGSNCSVCVDNVTCTICLSGSFLLNGKCYSICPSGYYGRTVDSTCQSCDLANCSICTALECTKCSSGFYGVVDATTNTITQCMQSCPDNYFPNSGTQLCQKCLTGCQKCTNSSTCQQCQSPKVLFISGSAYSCLDQCPSTYFINRSFICQQCGSNCNQCNSSIYCYNCSENHVLYYNSPTETTCISDCPQYYYKTLNAQGYSYCQACSANCQQCINSNQCTTCQSGYTLVNYICVPQNCVNCDFCDRSVNPPICLNCTQPFLLYKIKCFDTCPVYYFPTINDTTQVSQCQQCIENCVNCSDNSTCNECIPDYIFVKGQGCVNEAVYEYGQAANMSGFTSNITETMAKVYLGTSVGPVAFGEMSTTYFNVEFTQLMLFHPSGGNSQMTQFLNSLQSMSLTSSASTVTDNTAPQQVQARRLLTTSSTTTQYTQSFIQINASIFFLMFAFLGAYIAIYVFQRFITETCRRSCNLVWFYLDAICEFMQKRFKWIYFDFIMWLSYIPFLYFAVLQLKSFNFANGSQGFSSLLAIVIIFTYPLYPIFICYLMRSHYSQISIEPGEEIKMTLTEMSLSPYLTKVKRPIKNIVVPWQEQTFSCRKYFNKANFILIYYPLKYLRKFLFVMVAAIVPNPVHVVAILIGINVLFIVYIIALKPRVMPYLIFDLVIEFVLLAFEGFLLVYLILDGPKIAMMSIVTHAVGFIAANLSLITAIILNLIAYYKIFLCIKDLITHLRQKAAERTEAYNKFEVEKQFLDPNSDLYIEKEIGKLKRVTDNDDTDQDDEELRLSSNAKRLLENLGQKDLLLNGIDPIQYIKNLSKQQNYGIEEKEIALKYVNDDDITDSDDSSIDQNTMDLARKLEMNEKNLALNKIHPVKFAKQLTKNDAPLQKQYKKFDEKHVDRKLARQINDDGKTDSDDDSIDDDVMNIAKRLNLNEKQLAFNEINPVKFLKEDTKKDAPLQDRYKKFDEKNVDKKLARIINEDNATDSEDSEIDQDIHDLARKLQLNEKQLAFNQINPVKFFKEQTKKDAPLQEQYQKFDEKHIDKRLAHRINDEDNNTDSDDDSSVDENAHHLARKLNLNEKQLAFNEINPMKFFKDETKNDAPLQEQYKKFDEKNVDSKLARVINDEGDTDSDDDSEEDNDGYRLARELKLNEKQLAVNNLNPLKVMQEEAKKDEKLKNIMRQFDEKEMDLKVARMINDNGQTSSEQDDSDDEEVDKIIVARQLKLDEKELAVNNINPIKYVKQTTKIDPVTNEPKINQSTLSTVQESNGLKKKPHKKMLDKELQSRNQMKKELSENQYTDQDENEENIKLSKFNKEKLKNMTEKQMMLEGLDPLKAVKKITKQAIAKKMAKNLNNNRNYDDEIPDFKVSPKKSSNPITNVLRSTQQKLKESTKGIFGNKKDNLKGSQKLPSQQRFAQVDNKKFIDSDSDQQSKKIQGDKKKLRSQNAKIHNVKSGRRQIEEVWDDQFEIVKEMKNESHLMKEKKKQEKALKKPKHSAVDPNYKKNFDEQFSDDFNNSSEQNSQAALNHGKFAHQDDMEGVELSHEKEKNLNIQGNSRKVLDLNLNEGQKMIMKKDGKKRSESQTKIKQKIVMRQDEMFNEFEEFQDLSQIKQKQFKDKKYRRNEIQVQDNVETSRQKKQINQEYQPQIDENDQFEGSEISSVEDKQIQEPKFKRNAQKNSQNAENKNQLQNQVTQSYVFNDGQKVDSKKKVPSYKKMESQRYEDLVKKNQNTIKLPKSDDNQVFEQSQYGPRPIQKISQHEKRNSKMNSDNESDSGDFAYNMRKDRLSAKQRLRSARKVEQKAQSHQPSQKMPSIHKKIDRQTRLKMERVSKEGSEGSDDLEHIQI